MRGLARSLEKTMIRNKYERDCRQCRKPVIAYQGWSATNVDNKWATFCDSHREACALWEVSTGEKWTDKWTEKAVKIVGADWAAGADDTVKPGGLTDSFAPAVEPLDADALVARIGGAMAQEFALLVPSLVQAQLEALAPRTLEITTPKATVQIKTAHKALPTILMAVNAGVAPFLVGPAGSGKTTLAEQVATAMSLQFYMAARVTSEFKLVGFNDAQGRCVRTQFRDAYEHGGVFLFDEVDASDPDALTAFNAALANGLGDFPDGMVRRHKDFHAIAAGNTYGRGADRQYVGRNQLDAATLDRFQVFDIDYDEQLEVTLAGNATWTKYVQSVRKAIEHEKVRHIVSPRASISGAKLLAAGMPMSEVENACIWKGLPADARQRVEFRMAAQGN